MEIGDKVFIDNIFKTGYIYNFDEITNKYRVVLIEGITNRFYNVKKEWLYRI